jgi:predicted phosphoribosyltransferase
VPKWSTDRLDKTTEAHTMATRTLILGGGFGGISTALELRERLGDRMEIIYISGYTLQEKTEIARKYLIPKQITENGLSEEQIRITRDRFGVPHVFATNNSSRAS